MITSLSLDSRYDELVVSLKQIDALLDVATSADITELKPETLKNYLYVLNDILRKASNTCDNLANIKTSLSSTPENNNNDD